MCVCVYIALAEAQKSQDHSVIGTERAVVANRAFIIMKIGKPPSSLQLPGSQGAYLTQHWILTLSHPALGRCSINSC